MSQAGNRGAPTPRRSARLSARASSIAEHSVVTANTPATANRSTGPLPKVKTRISNAYGASGRLGDAQDLHVPATGFATAFNAQRDMAISTPSDDELDHDDISELANSPKMSGALKARKAPVESPGQASLLSNSESRPSQSRASGSGVSDTHLPGESSGSVGNISKSFGMAHETGMQTGARRRRNANGNATSGPTGPVTPTVQNPRPGSNNPTQHHPAPDNRRPENAQDYEISVNELVEQGKASARARVQNRTQNRVSGRVPLEQFQQSRQQQPSHQSARASNVWNRLPNVSNAFMNAYNGLKNLVAILINLFATLINFFNNAITNWTLAPIFKYLLVALLGMFLAQLFMSSTSPSSTSPQYVDSSSKSSSIVGAIKARTNYYWEDLKEWIDPGPREVYYAHPTGIPGKDYDPMFSRLMKTENRMIQTEIVVHEIKKQITEHIQQGLSEYVVVQQHKDGSLQIDDAFWRALEARFRSDNAIWDGFIKENEAKYTDLFDRALTNPKHNFIPMVISSREFQNLANTKLDQIVASHKDFNNFNKKVLDLEGLRSQLLNNMLSNAELSLSKANYFSPGLGAKVNNFLTSATWQDSGALWEKLARRLSLLPTRLPPKFALANWEEPGDCWCSGQSTGDVQLAVQLQFPVYPNQITLEHVPKEVMPGKDLTNAPKVFELWVESSEAPASTYTAAALTPCRAGGPDGFVCLGQWHYDIHGGNHVQTFSLDMESKTPVTNVAVRVVENWGADHTCLYRVRLHGADATVLGGEQ